MATTPPTTETWYKITNKETGEEQIVASLDGIDLTQWDEIAIQGNQAPTEFQTVTPTGALQTDQARMDLSDKVANLRGMTQDQFFEYVLGLESRITTLEAKG